MRPLPRTESLFAIAGAVGALEYIGPRAGAVRQLDPKLGGVRRVRLFDNAHSSATQARRAYGRVAARAEVRTYAREGYLTWTAITERMAASPHRGTAVPPRSTGSGSSARAQG